VASLVVHAPSFDGPFLSDDRYYIVANPAVREPSPESLRAILDPTSDLTLIVANWAPAHLLAHALQWQVFGERVRGYHVSNVLVHAAASTLLVAVLAGAGIPPGAAALGGAFFLLHPANAEVVGWISQIKTLLAMAAMLVALLLRGRRPWLGSVAFALALLSKALAAIALPVAAAMEWARAGSGTQEEAGRRRLGYLAAWAGVFAVFAVVEFVAFRHANQDVGTLTADLATRLCSSAAIAMRYLVMAATSLGVSAFHEPEPVTSPLDPWVLGALAAGALLGWRTLVTLRRRQEEAVWWIWAAGSFAPVAQVFPFIYPMADRYLYFILPGLIGGALLWGRAAGARLEPERRRAAGRAAALLAVGACLAFAVHSHARAGLWTSDGKLLLDTMKHYPEGPTAWYLRARRAAMEGDPQRAVEALRRATPDMRRGVEDLLSDDALARLRGAPAFEAFLREIAGRAVVHLGRFERLTEANLIKLAQAHLVLGDAAAARNALERALAMQGRYEPHIRSLLEQAEALERGRGAGAPRAAGPGPLR